ncbi:MAG: HTTM domain-containing protein [Myxococcota bacterium]
MKVQAVGRQKEANRVGAWRLSTTLRSWLATSSDPSGLAAFRILFGAIMTAATLRFWLKGWIHDLYVAPTYHFTYLGFDWVRPWPEPLMYLHFLVMGFAAFTLMLGAATRLSAAVFFVGFTYVELLEKAAYLNHYYLVSLLALLLVFVPTSEVASLESWWRSRRRHRVPDQVFPRRGIHEAHCRAEASPRFTTRRWGYALLRSQVAMVYLFAGFAKLNHDWLFDAEPLATWLSAHTDLPLVGPFMESVYTAYAMSWAGAIYDLSIVFLLSWSRTRYWAYGVSIVFHCLVWWLFPIGVFSWVMLASATLFFDPSWPRRVLESLQHRLRAHRLRALKPSALHRSDPDGSALVLEPLEKQHFAPEKTRALGVGATLAIGVYLLLQVLIPMRFAFFPGNVLWTEQGFRFAWRVMLIEKTGQLEYVVHADSKRYRIAPRRELSAQQARMVATQPDMIHQYALRLAQRYREAGASDVRVYAHSWASLNGRPHQRLVDPSVDLASYPRSFGAAAWLGATPWIVPLKEPRLGSLPTM